MKESIHPHIEMVAMEQPVLAAVALIACGMVCCYFGYRTTYFLIDVTGFIFIGMTALLLAGMATQGNLLIMGVALVAGGIIGAFLAHRVYRLGVMAFGGGVCALLAWHFSDALPSEQWELPVVIASGVLGGVLSLFLQRFIISLATAVLGGLFVAHGAFLLLAQFDINPTLPEAAVEASGGAAPFLAAWAGVAATGFLFQLVCSGLRKKT